MAKRVAIVTGATLALWLAGPAPAHDRDPESGSRVQERAERDSARAAERADEQAARLAEERIRIESRAAEDPVRAAEDLAKLEEDRTEQAAKAAEETAKIEEDRIEDLAKEAEDAAEDAAEMAEHGGDEESAGNSAMMRDLGADEAAEHDEHGFPVRRGELVAIDLAPATLRSAEARGFRVIERQHLAALSRELVRLQAPRGMGSVEARQSLRAIDPAAVVDLVHYYGLNFAAGARPRPVKQGHQPVRLGSELVVGVIDTAIHTHTALGQARVIAWKDGTLPGAPTEHGTAVASIIAGHGRATIYSANIFRGPPARPYTSAEVIAQALEWMLARDIPTINMSLAGPRNAILDRLVRDALGKGRSLIAAAGNGGPAAPPAYPGAVPGVIAVTAVDHDMHVYRYANRGRYISVAAPGVDVVAAWARGGLARFTGTSFAAPHIAGWIARCRATRQSSADCQAQLRKAARDLGSAGFDETYGYGFVR